MWQGTQFELNFARTFQTFTSVQSICNNKTIIKQKNVQPEINEKPWSNTPPSQEPEKLNNQAVAQ